MIASIHTALPHSIPDLQRLQYKCLGMESVWCPCIWQQAIDRAQVLVAVAGDAEVIAYGVCDKGRVCGVGVYSPFYRHGVGKAVLQHLEGSVTRVLEDDVRSQLWLKACGWQCDKIYKEGGKKYYQFRPIPPIEPVAKVKRKRKPKKTKTA